MTDQTDGGDIRALRALVLAADRYRHAVAAALDMGPSDAVAMGQLRAGALNARELATRTGLTPSTMTALLRRLEKAGLAQRSPHPTDRRQIVVSLTDAGHAELDRSERWLAGVLEHMDASPAEAERVLVALREALDIQSAAIQETPESR